MKIWIIAILCVSIVGFCAQESAELSAKTDHNKEEHERLCKVLKAAVGKWGEGGAGLSEPMKKALGRTIFGSESGVETVETLRSKLPDYYNGVLREPASRFFLCGHQPELVKGEKKMRWTGYSAPHDLLCLCTPGDGGWPLNNGKAEKLCGKGKSALGGGNAGWNSGEQGKDQMTATWTQVVAMCLKDGGKGENLKYALETFIGSLGERKPGEHPYKSLGKGNFSSEFACSGKEQTGICVRYYPEDQKAIPWWKDLRHAIEKEEQKEQKEREEAEKRKQEAQKQRQPQKQDQSQLPEGPRNAALRSTIPSSEETEQSSTENISNPLATLEDTSSTIIAQPCPWLLSSILLI